MNPGTFPLSKVIVIGAGLGGLSCAIQCRRMGLGVVVLERAPEIANVGAGIQIPPNATRVLQRYGLLPRFKVKGSVVEASIVRRYEDGQVLFVREQGGKTERLYGGPLMVIHRQDCHDILLEEAKRLGATIVLDACVQDICLASNKVILANGTEKEADVIVGADGLWSTTRDILLGQAAPPLETGDLAYRATFTREQLRSLNNRKIEEMCARSTSTMWMGPEKHAVFYPLRGGQEFNLVLLGPDNLPAGSRTAEGDLGELRETFERWDPVLTQLISCIPSVLKWKLMHLGELQTWTKGRVALLGDACHPTLPYQAQGAAMALEDGAVLGTLLGRLRFFLESRGSSSIIFPADPISGILQLYERLRKPRTTLIVQGAMRNRCVYHLPDGEEQEKRDAFFASVKDWDGVDAPMYTMIDSRYQRGLLGYASVAAAEKEFDTWCQSWAGKYGNLSARI